MLGLNTFTARAWVQSLVQLRSRMPCCATRRKTETDLCELVVTASSKGSRPGKTGGGVFEFEQKG